MGLIKAFLEKGYEVVAVAPEDGYTRFLTETGCRFYPLKMENKGSNPLKDISLLRQLYRIYKEIGPDIVLQFTIKPNIYGTLAASRLGIPVINNVSGLGTVFLHNNFVSKIAQLLYRVSFRYASKVFFQNEDDRGLFVNKKLVRKEKTALLPGSGVNLEKYLPLPFQRHTPFTFLLVARILYDKGIREYIEAIRLLKNKEAFRFMLLGALDEESALGIPKKQVMQWVEEGLIEYFPFTSDIAPFIEQADCLVLPSYREGTPRTLLEGAALAKPLISTNVPGCRDVVEEGYNGYLCRVKDSKDLANKMQIISRLPDTTLRLMGQNSRKLVVLKYDEKIVVASYLEEIGRILSSKNQSNY